MTVQVATGGGQAALECKVRGGAGGLRSRCPVSYANVTSVRKSPAEARGAMLVPLSSDEGSSRPWAMIEMQGELERKDGGSLEEAFDVGTLSVSSSVSGGRRWRGHSARTYPPTLAPTYPPTHLLTYSPTHLLTYSPSQAAAVSIA